MSILTLTPTTLRRLAIHAQHLSGPPGDLLDTIRQLGCLQLDPTSVVARSHQLVLWSRLGAYDEAAFERLLWGERQLFEYWAHEASICLTEHYPLHQRLMRTSGQGTSAWSGRLREWLAANDELKAHILATLADHGPLQLKDIQGEERVTMAWKSGGWTSDRSVARMLDHLWVRGEVLVWGRKGQTRLWHLAERVLPGGTPREALPDDEVLRRGVVIALRALGAATAAQVRLHFLRNQYGDPAPILAELAAAGVVERVRIQGEDGAWKGEWYTLRETLPLIERLAAGEWAPRTTLLSPFDNLICDRKRTERLWDFVFRLEIYVPREKRQYGYFVLPILHGDRLIGRIDPVFDRKANVLRINALHWEPGAPDDAETRAAVEGAIGALEAWLKAEV